MRACARFGLALAASLLTAPPARAADWAYAPFDAPAATYAGEVGLRFWYGKYSSAENLYDNTELSVKFGPYAAIHVH